MPVAVIVTGDLRSDRMIDEKGVESIHGLPWPAGVDRFEDGPQAIARRAQRCDIPSGSRTRWVGTSVKKRRRAGRSVRASISGGQDRRC